MLAFFMPTVMLREHFLAQMLLGARDAFGTQGLGKACARARRCTGRQHGDARAINSRETMAGLPGFHLQAVLIGSSSSERLLAWQPQPC